MLRRVQEAEQQNRELMSLAARKEEGVQKLQGRVEELLHTASSLSGQLEAGRADSRHQLEQAKDKTASKVRSDQCTLVVGSIYDIHVHYIMRRTHTQCASALEY